MRLSAHESSHSSYARVGGETVGIESGCWIRCPNAMAMRRRAQHRKLGLVADSCFKTVHLAMWGDLVALLSL